MPRLHTNILVESHPFIPCYLTHIYGLTPHVHRIRFKHEEHIVANVFHVAEKKQAN